MQKQAKRLFRVWENCTKRLSKTACCANLRWSLMSVRRKLPTVKHSVLLRKLKANSFVSQVDVDNTDTFGSNLNQTKKVPDLNSKTKSLVVSCRVNTYLLSRKGLKRRWNPEF